MAVRDPSNTWYGVFQRLQQESEVHRDQLLRALELGGVEGPVQEWVDQVFDKISRYATLNFDEFCTFIEAYKELQYKDMVEMFRNLNNDGSNAIGPAEVSQMLTMLGIKPMKHVIAEIFEEMDTDGSGSLEFEQFQEIIKVLRVREGFAKVEFFRIKKVFREHDVDHTGTLNVAGVTNVVSLLGYTVSQEDIVSIVAEVDREGGDLTECMVLQCLRRARELEVECIAKFLRRQGADTDLDIESVLAVCHMLGYFPKTDAILEVVEDIGLHLPVCMGIEEVWKILAAYREREGLTRADVEDIGVTFSNFDTQKKRVINTRDVRAALLQLGRAAPGQLHDVVQTIVAQVSLGEHELTLFGFKQVVRKFREWEIRCAQRLFDSMPRSCEDDGVLDWDVAASALRVFAHSPLDVAEEVTAADGVNDRAKAEAFLDRPPDAGEKGCSRMAFVKVALQRRENNQSFVKDHSGYTPGDVASLRERFDEFDRHRSGRVGYNDLPKLCMCMFPAMAASEKMRPALLETLQSSDDEPWLSVHFDGFLQLMRLHEEQSIDARVLKEQTVANEVGFQAHEINDFREIFVYADEGLRGALSFEQVSKLFNRKAVISAKLLNELRTIFDTVVPDKQECPGVREADFPDFLRLMAKLLAVDFANFQSAAPH